MSQFKTQCLWVTAAIIGLVALFFAVAPKPLNMDLTQIGTGRPAVVLLFDPNLIPSHDQATELKSAKETIGDQALFLVAKIGDPSGDAFQQQYQARPTELLFFDAKGKLVDRQFSVIPSDALIKTLSTNFTVDTKL